MVLASAVSFRTAASFKMVMSASFATSAACWMSRGCTYLPFEGRRIIWFSWAALFRMLRFSSSAFRPSRARCTRFSASAFATATSSSRCWRATSTAMAFFWACFCCHASAFFWFSASHSMISRSCTIWLYSARSARRCSLATCRARSRFSAFRVLFSSVISSSICCRSSFRRFFSALHSRS